MWGKRIAGIDPDTNRITLAYFYEDSVKDTAHGLWVGEPPEKKLRLAEHRLLPLTDVLWTYLAGVAYTPKFDFVYVEKPMYTGNPASTISQAAAFGMIRAVLHRMGIKNQPIDPGTWKKELIGSGRAQKEDVKQWAIVNLRLPDNLSQDAYDAYCIAWWGFQKVLKEGAS